MKKIALILIALSLCLSNYCYSQATAGLVAHWPFSGDAKDVSGRGHDGTFYNVTTGVGKSGVPNSALNFTGDATNFSFISVPSSTDFNFVRYSICATFKVNKFYDGLCKGNYIIDRGLQSTDGSFLAEIYDSGYDSSCSSFDSTTETISASAGPNNAPYARSWQMSKHIKTKEWTTMVATYDSGLYKVYINGILEDTVRFSSSVPIGTSSDSLVIGSNRFGSYTTYPYPFNGLIDDIRLYNRVLNDSEIVHLGDTCGRITLQPVAKRVDTSHNAVFSINTSIIGATYQWQQDAGTGFANLSNAGPYSGVNTTVLTITGTTTALNNDKYRCVISNTWGCIDTSSPATLTVTTGIANTILNEEVILYPSPASNTICVQVPYNTGNGSLQLVNAVGQVCAEKTINSKITQIDITGLPAGAYIARITLNGQVSYKKVLKN